MKKAWATYKEMIQEANTKKETSAQYTVLAEYHIKLPIKKYKDCDNLLIADTYNSFAAKNLRDFYILRHGAIVYLPNCILEEYGKNCKIQWKGKSLIINGKEKFE